MEKNRYICRIVFGGVPMGGRRPKQIVRSTQMFKKTLAAAAMTAAFAGSAMAADVTMYGIVDTGFFYGYEDAQDFNGNAIVDGESSLSMASGIGSSSRFGLKGSEDLGNGLKVSFVLENGFNTDDGTLNRGGTLFDREASLSLSGAFGTLSFGRMGGVASSAGTYDLVYAIADAFDGGDNNVLGLAISDRYDNMLTYQTPEFAGLQATVQYSFKQDSVSADAADHDNAEGSSDVNRYASFALTGSYGPAQFVAAYELQDRAKLHAPGEKDDDDQHTFYLGGNYDFGVAKVFAMAQYFMGARETSGFSLDEAATVFSAVNTDIKLGTMHEGLDGYGLHLGTIAPIGGGDMTVALYYVDAESEDITATKSAQTYKGSVDFTYYGLDAKYEYPLSPRTSVYMGAGYAEAKASISKGNFDDAKDKIAQAYVGLTHTF